MEEMLSAAVGCVRPVWNAVGAPAAKGGFKSAPGKSAPANFVSLKGSFAHWSNEEGTGVEVPLAGADLSVLFLLPKDEKGLTKFEKSWTLEKLQADIKSASKNYVVLEMPKVTLNYGRDVIPLLRTLGIKQAFAKGADYSPMTGTKEFHLSTLRHRTCLVLDDKSSGAPVAAAEAPTTFRLDRPFAVIVRQPSTGAILMVGRLAKP